MRNFTVTWHHSAQSELANLYLADPNPSTITRAANEIDRHLASNPTNQAIVVENGCYELTVLLLSVVFRIRHDDRIVEVLRVTRV